MTDKEKRAFKRELKKAYREGWRDGHCVSHKFAWLWEASNTKKVNSKSLT